MLSILENGFYKSLYFPYFITFSFEDEKTMQDQQGIIYCYYPSLGSNFFPKYNSILALEADKTSKGHPRGRGSKVSTRQAASLSDSHLVECLGGGRAAADWGARCGRQVTPGSFSLLRLLLVFAW